MYYYFAEARRTGGVACASEMRRQLLFALRHNEVSNGPLGLSLASVRLAAPLPMWRVREEATAIRQLVESKLCERQ